MRSLRMSASLVWDGLQGAKRPKTRMLVAVWDWVRRCLNAFLKAAAAFGGLPSALELVGAYHDAQS